MGVVCESQDFNQTNFGSPVVEVEVESLTSMCGHVNGVQPNGFWKPWCGGGSGGIDARCIDGCVAN